MVALENQAISALFPHHDFETFREVTFPPDLIRLPRGLELRIFREKILHEVLERVGHEDLQVGSRFLEETRINSQSFGEQLPRSIDFSKGRAQDFLLIIDLLETGEEGVVLLMGQGNDLGEDEHAEAVALLGAAPKIAHPVELDVVTCFLPLLDILVVMLCEVLGHEVVDVEPLKLLSLVLEDLVSALAGPLNLPVFLGD